MNVQDIQTLTKRLMDNMEKVIKGKNDVIEKIVASLLCGGHILLEDIPGTGKTTMAKALSKSIDCDFKRMQFTPDLLPSDLTGINFYNQKDGAFVLKKGSIFTNILLADEINRATPRTQSSLLECMEEGQTSIDSVTYVLDKPFLVIATQNPIEVQGTFPLPEAQLDRFFMKLSMGYPEISAQKDMLDTFINNNPLDDLTAVAEKSEIITAQKFIRTVTVNDDIKGYIIDLVTATRNDDKIRLGVSPRGTIAIMRASQAHAAMDGRNYVMPDDVKAVFYDLVGHRIICSGQQMLGSYGMSDGPAVEVIRRILNQTATPR